MKPLLEINNLSVQFRMNDNKIKNNDNLVINDLSIMAYPGEILTIVGASGSGKSILAEAILGLLPSNAVVDGDIYYDGKLIDSKLLKSLRGNEITYIPQSISCLDPLIKVGKQVRNCINDKEIKKKQRKIFEQYDLCENSEKLYPFQLSGGMARRVLISTSVIKEPSLIIADEPTPGLDVESAKKTMNYFRNFADENKAVVLITHDIELAINYSDKIAIFYAGHILELTKAKYFNKGVSYLRHPYTKALYNSLPTNEFKPIEGYQPIPKIGDIGCVFRDRCNYKEAICDKNVEMKKFNDEMVKCNYDFRS
ncbi:ABC transporter ATP-binding protein [Sedimentibacter sp. MB31-C6]|uniref:ABC transporter ATP-binding protein n=1 Tax=Sedimentibacter sp. MB31-C6 TaxID=3109366 RepID=UPI002DDC9932|nr:ABC transporter ATP-binding protein [Sedimentibacter sp. MB36-C1]WSI05335.1 ABC transporter ATP-binding protein [Sedimentibacter sp. MB36-C1]